MRLKPTFLTCFVINFSFLFIAQYAFAAQSAVVQPAGVRVVELSTQRDISWNKFIRALKIYDQIVMGEKHDIKEIGLAQGDLIKAVVKSRGLENYFKTAWEFYRSGKEYDAVICCGVNPPDVRANLVIVYSADELNFDRQHRNRMNHRSKR